MNEQNFDYLKDNIKYLGFGDRLNEALADNLKEEKDAFQLRYLTEVTKKPFEATLNFKKSASSDMYFLNNYTASLERSNGQKVEQLFYLNKGKGVTAKEAYNLLEGRAVYKELSTKAGEPYNAWIQLDFQHKDSRDNNQVRQFHENYGYDLKVAASKFAILEMDGGDKEKSLLHSLQKGNIQSATIDVDGETQKVFLEANPQFKTLNVYDDKMLRLSHDQSVGVVRKNSNVEPVKENLVSEQKDVKQVAKPKSENEMKPSKRKNSRQPRLSK